MPTKLKDNAGYIFGCTAMWLVIMYCFIRG